jgi:hypothetical protein
MGDSSAEAVEAGTEEEDTGRLAYDGWLAD